MKGAVKEAVKEIESSTFINCFSLEKITIPNSVEEIANEVFKDCKSLKEITMTNDLYNKYKILPSNVTYILTPNK